MGNLFSSSSSQKGTNAQQKLRAHRIAQGGCSACGETDHKRDRCRYASRLCFHCRKEGHILKMCPVRQREQLQNRNTRTRRK